MNGTETNTIPPSPTCAAAFLSLAYRIQSHARRLENLATWRDRLKRHVSAEDGEPAYGGDDFLRLHQACRDSGERSDDTAFFTISWFAESWAELVSDTDSELKELSDQLKAIEQREGLTEFDEFDPNHPETPVDWKALAAKLTRRWHELERLRDSRVVRFLLAHGETDMADLYANDRAAYDCRREAARLLIFGPLPDTDADTTQGDTGLT